MNEERARGLSLQRADISSPTTTTTTTYKQRTKNILERDVSALWETDSTYALSKIRPPSRVATCYRLRDSEWIILAGPQLTLEPVAIIRPVFRRLYCDYHAHIHGSYTTTARQRGAPPPLARSVQALLWFSGRHVGNELIIVITHVVTCAYIYAHVCMRSVLYIHRVWLSRLVKTSVCWQFVGPNRRSHIPPDN